MMKITQIKKEMEETLLYVDLKPDEAFTMYNDDLRFRTREGHVTFHATMMGVEITNYINDYLFLKNEVQRVDAKMVLWKI